MTVPVQQATEPPPQRRNLVRALIFVVATPAVLAVAGIWFALSAWTKPPRAAADIEIVPNGSPLPASTTGRTIIGASTSQSPGDDWHVIYLDGKPIGYRRIGRRDGAASDGLVRMASEMRLRIQRFGRTVEMRSELTSVALSDGTLRSFRLQTRSADESPVVTTGRVEDNLLTIETVDRGSRSTRRVTVRPGVKSPHWQDRFMYSAPLQPGESLRFDVFDASLGRSVQVHVAADRNREVRLPDGTRRELLRVKVTQSHARDLPVTAWLAGGRRVVLTETKFLNRPMTTFAVPAETALAAFVDAGFELGGASLIRLPSPLKEGLKAKRVVYHFGMTGRNPAKVIPASDVQAVKPITDSVAEITVTAAGFPKRSVSERPRRHRRPPREYTAPSRFLQTGDLRVREHARTSAAYETETLRIALAMERYVNRKLKDKNFSAVLATAADVARSLAGDCTEHAVLLAAMLRCKNVPSRVVLGLVYVPRQQSFGPHMWTEFWHDGRWHALDATLGNAGIGAAHIRIAESSFADNASPAEEFLKLLDILGSTQIAVKESK